jgi:hypothetical protein
LRYQLLIIYFFLGLLLVQYQNCAPNPESLEQIYSDTRVDGIDPVQVGEISFPQTKVAAFINENVTVLGVCGQEGSLISWTLKDDVGEPIERGLSECHLGSFEVALSDQWQGHCDKDLNLSAALGAKAASETTVETYCE